MWTPRIRLVSLQIGVRQKQTSQKNYQLGKNCDDPENVLEIVHMKKALFKVLATVNRIVLPRYSKADLTKLTTIQKAVVAYRYWVTCNALD